MTRSPGLSQWQQMVSTQLPQLSKSHATVLALGSFGMVLAQRCGLTSVTASSAPLVGRSAEAVRQQLRAWCDAAQDNRGPKRQALDVTPWFAPRLRWVLTWWGPTARRRALALDASTKVSYLLRCLPFPGLCTSPRRTPEKVAGFYVLCYARGGAGYTPEAWFSSTVSLQKSRNFGHVMLD